MKIGYQTIIWGHQIDDLEGILDVIAHAGFQGVEFAQRHDMLGDIEDISQLLAMLQKRNLELLGFAGGSLSERIQFCDDARPEFLYLEKWEDGVADAAIEPSDPTMKPFTLALHPHVFKPIHRLADAVEELKKHKKLRFLPDTAHLFIAGDDPLEAVKTCEAQLVAVHLKDWTPEYGRSSHRYARGFTDLGKGVVDIESVLQYLEDVSFSGWAVVEQDNTRFDPQTSVLRSASWLAKRGFLKNQPRQFARKVRPASGPRIRDCEADAEVRFVRGAARVALQGADRCYESIARLFHELIPAHLVTIWACSEANDSLSLLACDPDFHLQTDRLEWSKSLCGLALDERRVRRFPLRNDDTDYGKRRFASPELLAQNSAIHQMISIPIFNPGNHNHCRMIVNVFPKDHEVSLADHELSWFGLDVASAADAVLDERCVFASGRINQCAQECDSSDEYLEHLRDFVKETVNCEGVSIFIVAEERNKLKCECTTGINWSVLDEEQFYEKNEGLIGRVWARNEPCIIENARQDPHCVKKSSEAVANPDHHSYLMAPVADAFGEVYAVVRCRNKVPAHVGALAQFSDDDLAIVDAITQTATPHLQGLLAEERRRVGLARITHELKVPVAVVRGAAELIREELKDLTKNEKVRRGLAELGRGERGVFSHDYVRDISSWSELMRRLLGNVELFQYASTPIPFQTQKTLLLKDVIAPAVHQVRPLLRERGFSPRFIRYEDFRSIPALYIDRNMMQQVVFNLLSNAIKYAYRDTKAFNVTIVDDSNIHSFIIRFQDTGIGIDEGLEEVIFEEHFRSRAALEQDVAGHGIGLWIAQRVVEAHGGSIELTSNRQPTEFSIFLPKSLAHCGPNVRA